MDKESSLLKVKNKDIKYRCNKTTGFIKVFTDEEEDLIYQLIIAQREKLLPVSNKSLISYAGSIKKEFSEKVINTQLQWAYRFLHRFGFSIRRISHKGQSLPEQRDFIEDIIKKEKN